MKVRHLPKLAVVAIAIGGLVVLSGSAYATYQMLWPKTDAVVSDPTTSASGRSEVSLLFSSCGEQAMPERYELKRNATITKEQIADVVKAQCELQAINEWSMKTYNANGRTSSKSTVPVVSLATHIRTKDASSMTFVGLEKYNQPDTTLAVSSDVRYIANGREVSADQITPNDPVVYVYLDRTVQTPKEDCATDACREFGEYHGEHTLVAVVKLDGAFENYDQLAWQSLSQRLACVGNEADLCSSGYTASIDLYFDSAANSHAGKPIMTKEIQGEITQINGRSFTLKSSSGSIFTINASSDLLSSYNTNRSAGYNNQKVTVGSTLLVRYNENENEHNKNITANQLFSVNFLIEVISKGGPIEAY